MLFSDVETLYPKNAEALEGFEVITARLVKRDGCAAGRYEVGREMKKKGVGATIDKMKV